MKFFWTLLFFFSGMQLGATTLTEGFTTLTQKDTSAAVWNIATGFVHPTLIIKDYDADNVAPFSTSAIDVGDGSHGIFNSSTYANFGSLVGLTLTIDANVFPALKVTSFHLEPGYTLTSVNGPLVIYSQSTVLIDGVIQCSGINGLPAVTVSGGAGGGGRCGGSSGGNGGNMTASGSPGLPIAGIVTGGGGGTYVGAAVGAGGGGAGTYSGNSGSPGANSIPATNVGGTAGAGSADHEFTVLSGSPGGGGGSGSNTEGGGGGGGGGGSIIIHAKGNVTISNSGLILALGGAGGAANTGGGGGGGAGGSVQIFTPANLELNTGTDVDVTGGSGNVPATANAGDGGGGSFGRTWDISRTFTGAGSESNGTGLLVPGTVEYVLAPEITVSKSFDTGSALSTYSSVTTNPVHPDIVLQIAGSSDNFAADDTGWLNDNQVASLANKRYMKFRIMLTNSNALLPTMVNDVSITFNPGIVPPQLTNSLMLENFEFKSGCGSINATPPATPPPTVLLLLLFVLLLPVSIAGRLKLIKPQKKN